MGLVSEGYHETEVSHYLDIYGTDRKWVLPLWAKAGKER